MLIFISEKKMWKSPFLQYDLGPNVLYKIGSYNMINKKNSVLCIIMPQIDLNIIKYFSCSWAVVLRTLRETCLLHYTFEKESFYQLMRWFAQKNSVTCTVTCTVSCHRQDVPMLSLSNKMSNRHLKGNLVSTLSQSCACHFPISVYGNFILLVAQIRT